MKKVDWWYHTSFTLQFLPLLVAQFEARHRWYEAVASARLPTNQPGKIQNQIGLTSNYG